MKNIPTNPEKINPEKLQYLLRVTQDDEALGLAESLVDLLEKQEVLDLFICGTKLDELNQRLKEKLPDYQIIYTSANIKLGFVTGIIRAVADEAFEKENATEQDATELLKKYINEKRLNKLFDNLHGTSYMQMKFGFKPHILKLAESPEISADEETELNSLLDQAFPRGARPFDISTFKWILENRALAKAITLDFTISEEYQEDTFAFMRKYTQKEPSSEQKEEALSLTREVSEYALLLKILANLGKAPTAATYNEIKEQANKMAEEKPLYIQAVYSMFMFNVFKFIGLCN